MSLIDSEQPAQYAVVGNPIHHSLSPSIHAAFASALGDSLTYEKICADTDAFERTCEDFFCKGGQGLNITVPFKERAYHWVNELSEQAKQAGAVNTLVLTSAGKIQGHNTDGVGLVRDLEENLDFNIAGKRLLILGAGGAVKGVLGPLLKKRPACIYVANRTLEKAADVAQVSPGCCKAVSLEDIPDVCFDLVVNGTSVSLNQVQTNGFFDALPLHFIHKNTLYYDMMYSATKTPFLQECSLRGASRVVDGLGMLVEQAAEAYFIWRHKQPDTKPVLELLRNQRKPSA